MFNSIDELIAEYQAAQSRQSMLRDAPNRAYNSQEYYAACDVTSKVVFKMINHPDWTVELEDRYYSRKGEVPYPVSC